MVNETLLRASRDENRTECSSPPQRSGRRWFSPIAIALGALTPPTVCSQEKGVGSTASPLTVAAQEPFASRQQERTWMRAFGGRLATDDAGRDTLALNVAEAKVQLEQGLTSRPLSSLATVSADGALKLSTRFEIVARYATLSRDDLLKLLGSIKDGERAIEEARARSSQLDGELHRVNPYTKQLQIVREERRDLEEILSQGLKESTKTTDSLALVRRYLVAVASGTQVPLEVRRKVGELSKEDAAQSIAGLEKAIAFAHQAQAEVQERLALVDENIALLARLERVCLSVCRERIGELEKKRAALESSRRDTERRLRPIVGQVIASVLPATRIRDIQYELAKEEIRFDRVDYTGVNRLGNPALRVVVDRVGLEGPLAAELALNDPSQIVSLRGGDGRIEVHAPLLKTITRQCLHSDKTLSNLVDGEDEVAFTDLVHVPGIAFLQSSVPEWISISMHPEATVDLLEVRRTDTRIDVEGGGRIILGRSVAPDRSDFEVRIASTGSPTAPTIVSIPQDTDSEQQLLRISSTAVILDLQGRVTALLNEDTNIDVEVRGTRARGRIPLVRNGTTLFTPDQFAALLRKE